MTSVWCHFFVCSPPAWLGDRIVGDRIHAWHEWADIDSVAPRLYLTLRLLEVIGRERR